MDEKWILENLNVEEDMIFWNNNVGTPLDYFLSEFGELIIDALKNKKNPIKEIINNDPNNIKGFNKYLENLS